MSKTAIVMSEDRMRRISDALEDHLWRQKGSEVGKSSAMATRSSTRNTAITKQKARNIGIFLVGEREKGGAINIE